METVPETSEKNPSWRRLIAVCLLIILIGGGYLVYRFYKAMQPTYVRVARINDVAWGVDGMLYMRVQWWVTNASTGQIVITFDTDAVYRLRPDERLIRMIPSNEARTIIERWPSVSKLYNQIGIQYLGSPAHGWVGGRYMVYVEIMRDTIVAFKTQTRFEQTPRGMKPYTHRERVEGLGSRTGAHTWIHDWVAGTRRRIDAFFNMPPPFNPINVQARVSPDDKYLICQDTPQRRIRILWLPEGREVTIPDSVIPAGSDVYPTTRGLLDPNRRLLIDPETLETGEGWNPFAGLVPGQPNILAPDGKEVAGYSQREPRVGTQRVTFIFPSDSVIGDLPVDWHELDSYPVTYLV